MNIYKFMIKALAIFFSFCLVVGVIWGGSFLWDAYLIAPGPEAVTIEFAIENGEGVGSVAARLAEARVINSVWPFRLFLIWTKQDKALQAGQFTLSTGLSYAALTERLTRAADREVQVTIPEGLTLAQIGEIITKALPDISTADWQAATGVQSPLRDLYAVLAAIPEDQDLEGYLFPDTYRFRSDVEATAVAGTMVATLEKRLAEADIFWDTATFPNQATWHEVLTLASIVEREVRGAADQAAVADIFWKRLRIGMALQADSTVNFLTGGKNPSVSLEDIKINSPYNTYQRVGLPPGPISNPGIAAIKATILPTANGWYYFLTDSEGAVHYATTFDQHVRNKQKYLR